MSPTTVACSWNKGERRLASETQMMKYRSISQKLKLAFVAIVTLTMTAMTAHATIRGCEYEIFVKADGVSSFSLSEVLVRSEGSIPKTYPNSRGAARTAAAERAELCLNDAMEQGNVPASCRDDWKPASEWQPGGEHRMARFEFGSLPVEAKKQICAMGKRLGVRRMSNVRVYAKVRGGSVDVLRECSMPANKSLAPQFALFLARAYEYNIYYTLADYKSLLCTPYQ